MLMLGNVLLHEPTTTRNFNEEATTAGFSGLMTQPVSPEFKMGFTLFAMRVVEGDNTVIGSLSRFLVSEQILI